MKPRQFWISSPKDEPIFETFIANIEPDAINENDNYMHLENKKCVRVVEFSAYEEAVLTIKIYHGLGGGFVGPAKLFLKKYGEM